MMKHSRWLLAIASAHALGVSVRAVRRHEALSYASFKAAVFAVGDKCTEKRRDWVCSTVIERMDEGAVMYVALGDEAEAWPTEPFSDWGELLNLRSFDVRSLLEQRVDGRRVVGIMDLSTHVFKLPTHSLRPDEGVYLTSLAVHPDHRRQGVATALVEAADERARQVRALSVMLHVECDNLDAICFYEAARFTRIAENPRYRQFARALSIDPDSHYLYERPVTPR